MTARQALLEEFPELRPLIEALAAFQKRIADARSKTVIEPDEYG